MCIVNVKKPLFMRKSSKVSLEEIPEFAKKIAKELKGGEVLGLVGTLGAGKTTFTKELGKLLGIKQIMPSPTYLLMNKYTARLNKKPLDFYHLDVYRLNSPQEFLDLGITEFWQKPTTLTVIEWADKVEKVLPKEARYIFFK